MSCSSYYTVCDVILIFQVFCAFCESRFVPALACDLFQRADCMSSYDPTDYRRKRRLHPELYQPVALSDGLAPPELNGSTSAPAPAVASEQSPLLSSFSAHAPADAPLSPALQRARNILSYAGGFVLIVVVGIVAWFVNAKAAQKGRVEEVWDTTAQVVGWISAFLYRECRSPAGWVSASSGSNDTHALPVLQSARVCLSLR